MYDTGRWRREVVRRHPDTASVRYLAPAGRGGRHRCGSWPVRWSVGCTGSRFLQLGCPRPCRLRAPSSAYVTATAPASLSPEARRWLPAVLAATHLAWGSGFLVGRR